MSMRIAVISDVHGNVMALDAVLAELEDHRPEAIVVGGDVVSGPYPVETLERLIALERAYFVRGNGDREVVEEDWEKCFSAMAHPRAMRRS